MAYKALWVLAPVYLSDFIPWHSPFWSSAFIHPGLLSVLRISHSAPARLACHCCPLRPWLSSLTPFAALSQRHLLTGTLSETSSLAPCSHFPPLFYSTHYSLTSYEVLNISVSCRPPCLARSTWSSRKLVSAVEIFSEHLLCEWKLHDSPLKPRRKVPSATPPEAYVPKAIPNAKTIHLAPTWGVEAVRVILGGVGREDVHACVVRSTDGVGVDTGDHHMPLYEPVPAKQTREVIHLQGCDGDSITCHQTTSHAVPCVIQFTSGALRGLHTRVRWHPETATEREGRTSARLRETRWFYLELYKGL